MQKARRHRTKSAPTACKHTVSGTISLPFRGAFHLSLTVLVHYRSPGSTQPWRVVPPDSDRVSRERSYSGTRSADQRVFVYGTIALCGARFHSLRLTPDLVTAAGSDTIRSRALQPQTGNACPLTPARFRLVPFRSPLLGESRLISFRRGTEMCQFPRLPPRAYVFSPG